MYCSSQYISSIKVYSYPFNGDIGDMGTKESGEVEGVACMGYISVSRLTRPEAFASQYNGIIDE